MEKMWTLIKKFVKEEEGTETVEWAIVAGLVIVAAAALWSQLGTYVQGQIQALLNVLTPTPPAG